MTLVFTDGSFDLPVGIPPLARTVYDVTGAGDTVLATLSLALASGAGLLVAAQLANLAAGLAVEQMGTAPVNKAALCRALQDRRRQLDEVHLCDVQFTTNDA